MRRSVSVCLNRRAPPPPPPPPVDHNDTIPDLLTPRTSTSRSSSDHLTIESHDGTSFCVPPHLLSRSSFISDLCSLPGGSSNEVVPLDGISASVLNFALACAGDSSAFLGDLRDARRLRRHSAPVHGFARRSSKTIIAHVTGQPRSPPPSIVPRQPPQPVLIPPDAWSWDFLDQVLTLAFAYDLPHALERLAEDSGEFYDPVLSFAMWSLVSAAKGETARSSGTNHNKNKMPARRRGRASFPAAGPSDARLLMDWAPALLRYEGTIPVWCASALSTHVPAALVTLENLLSRRQEIVAEIAAAEARIVRGASSRLRESSWEDSKRNSWDIFGRRPSVATFFLRVDKFDGNGDPAAACPSPVAKATSKRRSLHHRKQEPTKCTSSCKPLLKRKLTAAVGLATRTSVTEKFGTLQYYVEYTYEGIPCAACRDRVKEALIWIWCMKVPWPNGLAF